MTSLLCIGEGMLELRKAAEQHIPYGYAGDTLNAAIYAKRFNAELSVGFLTGIGLDPYSQGFIDYCQKEGIQTDLFLPSKTANLGIYSIDLDDAGERSFYYWRKGSAATQLVSLMAAHLQSNPLTSPNTVFFSGLTMGILAEQDKGGLFDLLQQFKQQGSKIAFDPNYRHKMWTDKQHAIHWLEKAYAISDVILPGLDEHQELFGHNSAEDIVSYMQPFGFDELIIKCGDEGVKTFDSNNNQQHIPFNPAPIQVDSTAAGDSFAGTYLASRLQGDPILQSIQNADNVARFVVQHPGAIVVQNVFEQFRAKLI
jgi:2-dehydro-3-deoxygluconokinase